MRNLYKASEVGCQPSYQNADHFQHVQCFSKSSFRLGSKTAFIQRTPKRTMFPGLLGFEHNLALDDSEVYSYSTNEQAIISAARDFIPVSTSLVFNWLRQSWN